MFQPLHGVCNKCGRKTYLKAVQRSPGDWVTYYECPNCDTGLKGFAKGCLANIILWAFIGLGMSLLGFLFVPDGLIKVLVGLLGLVIVILIIKTIW